MCFSGRAVHGVLRRHSRNRLSQGASMSGSIRARKSITARTSTGLGLSIPFISEVSFLFAKGVRTSCMVDHSDAAAVSSARVSRFRGLGPLLADVSGIRLSSVRGSSASLHITKKCLGVIGNNVSNISAGRFGAIVSDCSNCSACTISRGQCIHFGGTTFMDGCGEGSLLAAAVALCYVPMNSFREEEFSFVRRVNGVRHLVSSTRRPGALTSVCPPRVRDIKVPRGTRKAPMPGSAIALCSILCTYMATRTSSKEWRGMSCRY